MTRQWTLAALLGACMILSGCVAGGTPYPPVPPPQPETVDKPPVSATPLLWQPGHWDWTGAGYTWIAGGYVPIEGHTNMWMAGHWVQATDGTWVWQQAHWM